MLHPKTILKHINTRIGCGVFASEFIPAGTLTYVKDELEMVFDPQHDLLQHPVYGPLIDKYAYTEASGQHVVGWDLSKYVNHSCYANTMSTGYGFEIAIRDIRAGEELTDDYGFFNVSQPMRCTCQHEKCREIITQADIKHNCNEWDRLVKIALDSLLKVPQPLIKLVDAETYGALMRYLETGKHYRSVALLQHHKAEDSVEQASTREASSLFTHFDAALESPF